MSAFIVAVTSSVFPSASNVTEVLLNSICAEPEDPVSIVYPAFCNFCTTSLSNAVVLLFK